MRKLLLGAVVLIILIILGWLSFGIIGKAADKEKLEAGAPMPAFSFEKLDGSVFRNSDLAPDRAVLFKYFNPECDHCLTETRDLIQNIRLFEHTQIVMLSPADQGTVAAFRDTFQLNNYPQITVLLDSGTTFGTLFGEAYTPCSYVYDKQHELIAFIRGEVKMTYIHQLLQQQY